MTVANFSRFTQYVELNLASFKGFCLYELFGRTRFPDITDQPYLFTIGPHAFYWFAIETEKNAFFSVSSRIAPLIESWDQWQDVFQDTFKLSLENACLTYFKQYAWFNKRDRPIRKVSLQEKIPFLSDQKELILLLFRVDYDEDAQLYLLPLEFVEEGESVEISSQKLVARIKLKNKGTSVHGRLYDAFHLPIFFNTLLRAFLSEKKLLGDNGTCAFSTFTKDMETIPLEDLKPTLFNQSEEPIVNVAFNHHYFLKIYRIISFDVVPEIEINQFLTQKGDFSFITPLLSLLTYHSKDKKRGDLAFLQKYIENQGSGWHTTLDELERYFERVMTRLQISPGSSVLIPMWSNLKEENPPEEVVELIGSYLEKSRLIGEVTAKMHLAFASENQNAYFAPEQPTPFYLRSNFQSKRNLVMRVCQDLERAIPHLSDSLVPFAEKILLLKEEMIRTFEPLLNSKFNFVRIRCHGNYHLGHLLFTGKDFMIIGFAQDIDQFFGIKRKKKSAFRDIASMLRSFHFAAFKALEKQLAKGLISIEKFPQYKDWPIFWQNWVGATFVKSYIHHLGDVSFLPKGLENFRIFLNAYLLEKALENLRQELEQPSFEWLEISLQWILTIQEQYVSAAFKQEQEKLS